jgi:ankyrin repeat protein
MSKSVESESPPQPVKSQLQRVKPNLVDHAKSLQDEIAILSGFYFTIDADGTIHLSVTGSVDTLKKFELAPMHAAAARGNLEVLRMFLDVSGPGAAFVKSAAGTTPVHLAVRMGRPEVVRMLLAGGVPAEVTVADAFGRTPLHYACISSGGDLSAMVTALVLGGVPVDQEDAMDNTALHLACRKKAAPATAVCALISAVQAFDDRAAAGGGAPIGTDWGVPIGTDWLNVSSLRRSAPIHSAFQDLRVLIPLLEAGACPSAQDYLGQTILHRAAQQGRHETCTLLAGGCPDLLDIVDGRGSTPMHLAVRAGAAHAYFPLRHTNHELRDWTGSTPVELAIGGPTLAEFLRVCTVPERYARLTARQTAR